MKIERINDNQIRCTLNKADLAGKETLLNELAFGSDNAKDLFRDLMRKASSELGFETNNIPLMVEAIPVSSDCLVLVITKVDDPDEFNERYQKLSEHSQTGKDIHISGGESVIDLLENENTMDELEDTMMLAIMDEKLEIYSFPSLDEISHVSKLACDYPYDSKLYKDPDHSCYYLTILNRNTEDQSSVQLHQILTEYGKRIPNTYATQALFHEHLQMILDQDAMRKMAAF